MNFFSANPQSGIKRQSSSSVRATSIPAAMNQDEYDKKYQFRRRRKVSWVKRKADGIRTIVSRDGLEKAAKRRVPLIKWMSRYQWSYLAADIIAGVTVGIYNVPQAMSYATLAGLPPVYGLYASFFPPILYFIFGSATHSSIGVFSITCLMVNKCVEELLHQDNSERFPGITKTDVISSLCILTGLIQLVMALVRCNKLMNFLSETAISAVTFSACFYGVVNQIPKLCGFSVPSRNEPYFHLFYAIDDIAENIHKSNIATVCISVCTLVFLIFARNFIEPVFNRQKGIIKGIPFPKELITIVVAILASHFMNFEKKYGVKILKNVPTGFPSPSLPRIDIWAEIYSSAIGIAVVSYAVTMAMGQIFAKKYKYRLDSNQELLALGLVNVGSAFFPVFPTSCSLSRTLVNEKCGARSQLSGFIAALCILIVIMFIGPLLESLPSCVLAAIVLVVVEPLLRKCTDLPMLWRCSKADLFIWIGTATATLCTDIAPGVAVGISLVILNIAIQSQQATVKILGQVKDNDFRPIDMYDSATETSFRIIHFVGGPVSENCRSFEDVVMDATNIIRKTRSGSIDSQGYTDWTAIILDCTTWTRTDHMGIQAVDEVNKDLRKTQIFPLFVNLKASIRRQYCLAGILEQPDLDEAKLAKEEARILEEEARIQEERRKCSAFKVSMKKYKKRCVVDAMESGEDGNAHVEIKLCYDEKELDKAERDLFDAKKDLALWKKQLAQQNRSKDMVQPVRISQNQFYPSITDAMISANLLVKEQGHFFDIKQSKDGKF
ncbi:hypothetical protein L5515_017881 [Caenorhabditis briggsae]|uniref:SLC26A/SulP transporter domain-containing protein n=1 Tax=Caenorhabditis briggsae TaxID=6238 RepID=A0AAE8ZT76_CAEBR|nr:hypothetical protein L3Y34_012025 [Caenorhabditis briggsae]UMM41771.1 hypothetical protein L5515_017881 [Caenorhabditis briggsae]